MAGFKKDDHGKPRYGLIPPHAELELARVLTMGAEKYGADNWRKGGAESIPRYVDAAQRHIAAYRRGEELDGESGLQHLAHAVASLMFIMELEGEAKDSLAEALDKVMREDASKPLGAVLSYIDSLKSKPVWMTAEELAEEEWVSVRT